MGEDADHALTHPLERGAQALLALAWWLLFATLIWVCFLRPGPRSLARTIEWFSTPQSVTGFAVLALIGGGALVLWHRRRAEALAVSSLSTGLLTLLLWGAVETLS